MPYVVCCHVSCVYRLALLKTKGVYDERADIYSLAVTIHWALTDEPPYDYKHVENFWNLKGVEVSDGL